MAIGTAILVLYLGAYGYFRVSGHLVRVENRSSEPRHAIVARAGEWDDILVEMSQDKPAVNAYAKARHHSPDVLNVLFWPLRTAESGLWRVLCKSANQCIQRTAASRLAQLEFQPQWRLAPAADTHEGVSP